MSLSATLARPASERGLAARFAVIGACLVAWTLSNLDQSLFSYALPGILATFHLPLEAAGLVLAISFATASALVVLAGVAADRYGRGPALAVLLGLSAVFVGLQGFAAGVVTLTLARAMGFGLSGGLSPITNALVVENAPDKMRGMAMGVLQCGYPLGWFLAAVIAAPLLRDHGWRAACFAAFGVIPLAVLLGLALRRAGASVVQAGAAAALPKARVGVLFSAPYRRQSLACMATFFLFGGAYAGSAFFFPTYFAQSRGYAPADAASLVGLSNAIAVIGYLAAAYAGERLLRRRTVFTLWAVGGAAALLGLLWLSPTHGTDLAWFSVMAALFYGAMAVLPVLVAELFDHDIRATALGVCTSAPLSLGFAVFPLLTPLAVGAFGWPVALSLVVAPLIALSALCAQVLPNRASGLPVY